MLKEKPNNGNPLNDNRFDFFTNLKKTITLILQ